MSCPDQAVQRAVEANYEVPSPASGSTLEVARSPQYVPIVTTAASTLTLADPSRAGLLLTLHMVVDGGDMVVTAATSFDGGNTVITLDDVGDVYVLQSVRKDSATVAYRWQLVSYGNAAGVREFVNGTAPSAGVANQFLEWSEDIVAGNAAPHFMTEAGDIIKLYKNTTTGTTTGFTAGAGTAVNDDSTFTGDFGSTAYTVGDVVLALKKLGVLKG